MYYISKYIHKRIQLLTFKNSVNLFLHTFLLKIIVKFPNVNDTEKIDIAIESL